jgi:hypothetical protein
LRTRCAMVVCDLMPIRSMPSLRPRNATNARTGPKRTGAPY